VPTVLANAAFRIWRARSGVELAAAAIRAVSGSSVIAVPLLLSSEEWQEAV
jgi:hypothetical protein